MSLTTSIFVCLIAFLTLLLIYRRDTASFGLPIAYLFALLLIHVPGAIAHLVGSYLPTPTILTEKGMTMTALGSVAFVIGAALGRRGTPNLRRIRRQLLDNRKLALFCLLGGWFFTYGLSFLGRIPSLGAAIEKGGAIWMLGVILGLRVAIARQDVGKILLWFSAMAVYPLLMLLLGGFLSYGSTAAIIVLGGLAITLRNKRTVLIWTFIVSIFAFNAFLNYFDQRETIRDAVWGGAPLASRIQVTYEAFRDFEWFDSDNTAQLSALDQRLNQNYFVGLAITRIDSGSVDYLYGRSVWEGILGLVPRAFWPDKPVYAGSPKIVAEMTGLRLNPNTSFGVGNVMEFYINFGVTGVIVGFVLLGWLISWLDRRAAMAEFRGELTRIFLFFLFAVALIQPNGSMVELTSGSAAAVVAAYGWAWAYRAWFGRKRRRYLRRIT